MKAVIFGLLISLSMVAQAEDKSNCEQQAKKAINFMYKLNDGLGVLEVSTTDKPGLGKVLTYRDTQDGRFTAKVSDGFDICVVLSVEYDQD